MYQNNNDLEELIRDGEEASRIMGSPLYARWVENVQNDLLHLLQADNGSRDIDASVWFLRGAYSFRTHLEMVVARANRAREQLASRTQQVAPDI